ncbi:hypothetical protein [Rhizobium binae]|uniref:hypothetical protein n=1 Tax=Rhizobium binae TaxID=1138190 RepID=UPI0021809EE5|nr:hypothetical protein [Rhizobium binae]
MPTRIAATDHRIRGTFLLRHGSAVEGKASQMGLGSIFRYAQLFVIALMMAVNPFGIATPLAALQGQHSAVAAEHHHGRDLCGHQTACCSAMHCCQILPELAAIAAPQTESMRHDSVPESYQPLLLIRPIDPPPRDFPA